MRLPIILLLMCGPLYAEESTWLCIGEHLAQVTNKNNVLDSYAARNNEKWIITSEGLKTFGSDRILLDICYRDKSGRPRRCNRKDGLWAGDFYMEDNNVFVMSAFNIDIKNDTKFAWVIGRCSKL